MKLALSAPLGKNISPRAAGAAVTLVLLASLVTGREAASPHVEALAEPAHAARIQRPAPASESTAALEVQRLHRKAEGHAPVELFAARANPAMPEQAAEPAPPPAPTAPPLPFRYLGKLIEGGKLRIFLANGEALHTVQSGETLENLYKVELVSEEMVTFTFIPLGTSQTLAIDAPT
jgi:nucleoid-associated protein YgaU